MNNNQESNDLAFSVRISDIQDIAVGIIGRKLDDVEMRTAVKCVESGLSFGLDTILKVSVEEAVEI